LYGLNELTSNILYDKLSKEQALLAFNKLQQWQKVEKNAVVVEWVVENVEIIRVKLGL
jgi:hypothetical protein